VKMRLFEFLSQIKGGAMSLPSKLRDRRLGISVCDSIEKTGGWIAWEEVVATLWLMCCPKGLRQYQ